MGHEEGEGQVCLPGPVSSGDSRDYSFFDHDLGEIWTDTGMSLVQCFYTPFTTHPFPIFRSRPRRDMDRYRNVFSSMFLYSFHHSPFPEHSKKSIMFSSQKPTSVNWRQY